LKFGEHKLKLTERFKPDRGKPGFESSYSPKIPASIAF
jgi:hypothetical protein